MGSPTPRNTTPRCDACGWTGKRTTEGMAAYARRRHSCDKQRRRDASRARREARMAAVDRTPKPCHHKRTQHLHGTHACYVLDACRCVPCTRATAAYERMRTRQTAYGRWRSYVDAEPVRHHVRRLQADGLGWKRISALSGVPHGTLSKLIYGDTKRGSAPSRRIRPTTAAKLLAVHVDLDALGATVSVDGTGTRRRLQALVAIGWSMSKLACELGMLPTNLPSVIRRDQVQAGTARAVRALYDRLWNVAPPQAEWRDKIAATRARSYAAQRCWLPPMAWDDDIIDNPAAAPDVAPIEPARRGRQPVVNLEDVEFLREQGESLLTIAARLGVTVDAIHTAIARRRAAEKARRTANSEAVA